MNFITEQPKKIPIAADVDVCVLGGSVTGVFAAVRAARLGARVAIVEKQNCFGGTATCNLMFKWHTFFDTEYKKQIIAGLHQEIIDRLKKRPNAVVANYTTTQPYRMHTMMNYRVNTEELKIELDELIKEAGVKPYLHSFYSAPHVENGELKAVIIENKSGRFAINSRLFIDATADGDLCVHLGLANYSPESLQPATTTARVYRWHDVKDYNELLYRHSKEYGLQDVGWDRFFPDMPEVSFLAKTNVHLNCADGDELTEAEIEGRRQLRAMMDILRKYGEGADKMVLLQLCSRIGIRETRQVKCQYQVTFEDIINGRKFEDAVVNDTYPADIHHDDKPGATYWYLDGVTEYDRIGYPMEISRWREPLTKDPTYWQIPYRALVPGGFNNVIVCGRAIDADKGAFSATRSLIACNQTGEAAGVAAYEALNSGKGFPDLDVHALRRRMKESGSVVL